MARAHLDLGNFETAQAYAKLSAPLLPKLASPWVILGIGLRRTGQLLHAQEALERALELGPDDAMALAELGCNDIALGDYEDGIRRLERARAVAPDWAVLRWLDALALPVLPEDRKQ